MPDIREVGSRPGRFLIGRRTSENLPLEVAPFDLNRLEELLNTADDITVLERVGAADEPIFVVEMELDRAALLENEAGPALIVEEDAPLDLLQPPPPVARGPVDPGLELSGDEISFTIVVMDRDAPTQAVPNATVYLIAGFFPAKGRTDAQGRVTLTLFGESSETINALFVKPGDTGHWSLWIDNPDLDPNADNLVQVRPLSEIYNGFPTQEIYGWGQQAMKLSALAASHNGAGARIAVIDSGIHTTHNDLTAGGGHDYRDDSQDPIQTWRQDSVGHGSHCTGVIAGIANGFGIRGFAPGADVFGFRIFEGGKTSWLIGSLQQCVDDQIDVVNLSLGSSTESELLHQTVRRTVDAGVVLVAAAGNSADSVNYPARWPEVIAVSAIGAFDTFPDDSRHARQVGQHISSDGRYFSASFTCFGEEIDVCAPGVAVVSSVPANGYAAWDGTSMACPHVTGLAALILAHRDDVPELKIRNAARTQKVKELLREAAVSLGLPTAYQGAGLPDVLKALGQQPIDGNDYWEQLSELLAQALAVAKEAQTHA